jgi:translocation and assembly module TamA
LNAFGGNFGLVPFFDGRQLTNAVTPDFNRWQFGAGIGLRYYSSFGPIRIDVGTPLNPRSGDGPIAAAVSLGQAF